MKQRMVGILVCPKCKCSLSLLKYEVESSEIKSGKLVCPNCHKEYLITNFIPRFVENDAYVDNFSFEWQIHNRTQLDSALGISESDETFRAKTGFTDSFLKDKLILDAGCGMGRFTEIVENYGGHIVGVDLSYAVESAFQSIGLHKNVDIVQADIMSLPFRDKTFDVSFSIGVLHHTPDTRLAFQKLVSLTKDDGEIAIWVYSNEGAIKIYNFVSMFWRLFTTRMPKRWLYNFCRIAVPMYYVHKLPIIGYATKALIPTSYHPIPEWRILDTFDWLSAKYQWKHTYKEVIKWFEDIGLHNIRKLSIPVSVRGCKSEESKTLYL